MGTKSVAPSPAGISSDSERPPREGNFISSLSATMTDRCVPPSNLSAKSTCHPCLLVFGDRVRIFWCIWHVIQAMTNWFTQKWRTTPGGETQKKLDMKNEMIKLVQGYVPSTSPADDWRAGYDAFIREYQNSTDEKVARCFKYFQQQWAPSRVRRAKALRADCSYGGSDTTGTIESYHNGVKTHMKAENKTKINQRRIDWFLYFFVNTLLPYFCEREIDGEATWMSGPVQGLWICSSKMTMMVRT